MSECFAFFMDRCRVSIIACSLFFCKFDLQVTLDFKGDKKQLNYLISDRNLNIGMDLKKIYVRSLNPNKIK